MKVLLLAGGYGTRLSEETSRIPKPMVEIGGYPILWHIMKLYSHYGFNDFVVLLGYKGYCIKEYFANYFLHCADVTIDLAKGAVETLNSRSEPWRVTLIDTGLNTMTGGRIKRVSEIVGRERFMLTYGDGVANIDLNHLVRTHEAHGKLATMTSVQPAGRFGKIISDDSGRITSFQEKPPDEGTRINGGFFVLEPEVFDYLPNDDSCIFERAPLQKLTSDGQLFEYRHDGFWQCMDTVRDLQLLNELWENNKAEWKLW